MEYVAEQQGGTWSKIGPYSPDGTILPGIDRPLEYSKQARRIAGGEITYYSPPLGVASVTLDSMSSSSHKPRKMLESGNKLC